MATDWMRKSCPPEHQVAVVSTDNSGKLVTAAAMTAQHQQQAVSRMCTTSSLITYDNDYNERRIPRDESPSEAQVFLSATPPVRKLARQPPVRMPSVVISDCSDEANTDPTELVVICNGDCPHPAGSCEDQLGRCVNNNHVNSDRNNPPVSPDLSSKSPSSAVQEMDPLDHQCTSAEQDWNCWPPTLRTRSGSMATDGFLVLPAQEEESTSMLSSINLLSVRRLSDCSSSSSLATLDMEPCCSGGCSPSTNGADDVDVPTSPDSVDDSGEQSPPTSTSSSSSSDPNVDEDERIKRTDETGCLSSTSSSSSDPAQLSQDGCIPSRHHSTSVKVSAWRKVRSAVQWSPFVQTFRRQRYPWVQLAGHQGNFKLGGERGTILKKLCPKEESCFQLLMDDPLRPFIPSYKGHVSADDGEKFLVLEDLLGSFRNPSVMDCKLGVRTYLEDELAKAKLKPKLRKDMFEKMLQVDPTAPTPEELQLGGVTKPRYMVWRETISSTASLGFRIEGIRKQDGSSTKEFKTVGTPAQIIAIFREFVKDHPHALARYIQRLKELEETLNTSKFFATHELIGSSLLFIHDQTKANIWMIDFAKTHPLPPGIEIDHKSPWRVGNHEDGYLTGLANLTQLFNQLSVTTDQDPV